MGSDEPQKPSLEVSFGRKRRETRRAKQAAERSADRGGEAAATRPAATGPTITGQAATEEAATASTVADHDHDHVEPRIDPAAEAGEPVARAARSPRRPWGVAAASVVTGVVVGLVMVGMGAGALTGCASLRGTASCGGVGLPILLVILALGVVLGSLLLQVLSRTSSSMSISFLAVAFVAVVSGLFLLDALDVWPALVIVPVLSVAGYLASHWLTTHYIDPVTATGPDQSSSG